MAPAFLLPKAMLDSLKTGFARMSAYHRKWSSPCAGLCGRLIGRTDARNDQGQMQAEHWTGTRRHHEQL